LRVIKDAKLIGVAVSATLLAIGAINLCDQLSTTAVADDGVHWSDTKAGVRAEFIHPNSPLAQVIRKGDYLRYIFYRGKYEGIERAESVHQYLNELGAGNQARYQIERSDGAATYEASFKIVGSYGSTIARLYLALVGLAYLAAGL
jgi:hypothetical protein